MGWLIWVRVFSWNEDWGGDGVRGFSYSGYTLFISSLFPEAGKKISLYVYVNCTQHSGAHKHFLGWKALEELEMVGFRVKMSPLLNWMSDVFSEWMLKVLALVDLASVFAF